MFPLFMMFYLKYRPYVAIQLFYLSILAIMIGMVNVEWHGQDYLHLKWHVVCSGLATPVLELRRERSRKHC